MTAPTAATKKNAGKGPAKAPAGKNAAKAPAGKKGGKKGGPAGPGGPGGPGGPAGPGAPANRYSWKPGARFGFSAEDVAELVEEIRERDGSVKPAAMVDRVRHDHNNPVHSHFDWNDKTAGEKHRIEQARKLLSSLQIDVVTRDGTTAPRMAYVSVEVQEVGRSYLPTSIVMDNTNYREQALADAYAALEGWRRRYNYLEEFAAVVDSINDVLGRRAGGGRRRR